MTGVPGSRKVTVRWSQPLYTVGGITGYKVDRSERAAVKVSSKARPYTFTVNPIGKSGLGPTSTRNARAK